MLKILRSAFLLFLVLGRIAVYAQVPTLSYTTPQVYTANTLIAPLAPVSTGVVAPAYSNTVTTPAYGFDQPVGIAVDVAGNVYMCDFDWGEVLKYPVGGGATTVIASGFGAPAGLAVDVAGNVYVTDNFLNAVYKITAGSNSVSSIGSGFNSPFGVAVDAAGNVYVADGGNSAIKKIPVNGSTPVTIGTGFSTPEGVAVDAAGNVFVADYGNNAIKEILVGGGPIATLASGLNLPFGVSVDNIGDVYFADTGNALVKELRVGSTTPITIGSGFQSPTAVATDINGNVYVADIDNQDIEKISPAGGYFISPALPPGLTFNQTTGVISGTSLVSSPATNYTVTAYNTKGSKTAIVNIKINVPPLPSVAYTSQSFVAGAAITPITPVSSNVAAANYSLTSTQVGANFTNLSSVAVDGAGNVYVVDNLVANTYYTNYILKEIPLGIGSTVTLGSSENIYYGSYPSLPVSLGQDGNGNVYANGLSNFSTSVYSTASSYLIEKFTAGVNVPFIGPTSFTGTPVFDAAGNVYVAGSGVVEYYADNSGNTTIGNTATNGVATDPAGDLYVTTYPNTVAKITPGNSITVPITRAINTSGPIIIDGGHNLYVADAADNALYKITGANTAPVTIGVASSQLSSLAIDGQGNIFSVGYHSSTSVKKTKPVGGYYIYPFLPAGLSFNSTTGVISGTPLSPMPATTYTITAYNCAGKTQAKVTLTITAPPALALPVISYSTPLNYTVNTAITPITPTSTGVTAAKYNTTIGTIGNVNIQGQVAVDGLGNYYTATTTGNILKTPQGGGTPVIIATGFSVVISNATIGPLALAADLSGNVFVAAPYLTGGNAGYNVVEVPVNGGLKKAIPSQGVTGLATDAAGNLYVSETYNSSNPATGSLLMFAPGSTTPVTISGITTPIYGVAVDGLGNIYVPNANGNITMLPANGGAQVTVYPGFSVYNNAIAADAMGNLFAADNTGNAIHKITNSGANNVIFAAGVSGGIAVNAAGTLFVANAASQYVKTVPAAGGTPVSVGFGFTAGPKKAVSDAAGNIYTIVGTTVQQIPVNGNPVAYSTGYSNLQGLAIDGAGNMYVTDAGFVYKLSAGTGTKTVIGSGFTAPTTLAVDGQGNVYVNDSGKIFKIPTYRSFPINLGLAFQNPTGIAVDNAGNIIVADAGANAVTRTPLSGGSSVIIGSGFYSPADVAVDASGDVYVVDAGAHSIKQIPASNAAPVVLGPSFEYPASVSIGNNGVLYVTDGTSVKTVTPSGGYYTCPFFPAGLKLDQGTGVISGVPLAATPATNYTITGYNRSGSAAAITNITVTGPVAPVIKYVSPQIYVAGTAIAALTPTSTAVAAPAYSNVQNTIAAAIPAGSSTATDAAGNLYVANYSLQGVLKYSLNGSVTTLTTNIGAPFGVAVDGAGNIFVSNAPAKAVYKLSPTGTLLATITSGLSYPQSLATDAAGNVFVCDYGDHTIKEIAVNTYSATIVSSSFTYPVGLAVDAPGNIYVADLNTTTLEMIPAGTTTVTTIGSGFSSPNGVAVDVFGNVYVADGGNKALKMIPASAGAPVTIATGFTTIKSLSIDGAGNLYALDTGTGLVKEIPLVGGYYINPALPAGLSFNVATGIISGTPTTPGNPINYTVTAYNTYGAGATVLNLQVRNTAPATISYAGPQTYNLGTGITPLTPTTTGVAAAGYSSGAVTLNQLITSTTGLAADAVGNVYEATYGTTVIEKVTPDGSASVYATGFLNPTGVAVDVAGNVFVADYGNSLVKEIPVGGGAIITLGSGFKFPYGIAVDANDNVFVTDQGNNIVKEIPAVGGTIISLGSGFTSLTGIAVDASGNIYVADNGSASNNSMVKVIPAGNGAPITLYSGLSNLQGVAVDAANELFVAGNNTISMSPPARGGLIALGSDYSGVAIDGAGALYVEFRPYLQKITPVGGFYLNRTLPAGLSFNSSTGAITGAPIANTPAINYTVTAYNAGGGTAAVVNIKTMGNTNAALSNMVTNTGTLSPAFATATTGYTESLPFTTSTITITPTVADNTAIVKVNGITVPSGTASAAITIFVGSNTITVAVTAQDGVTTKTYTITVTRAASTNAALSNITLSKGTLSPAFVTTNTSYTDIVTNGTTSVTLAPTISNAQATVTVNGVAVKSTASSGAIALSIGSNTISVVCTAPDGVTTKTYTVTVIRPSTNAKLANLTTNAGAVTPVFNPATISYTLSVTNATTSITLTPTIAAAGATIKVNGAAVTSGSASGAIALSVGINTITTIVTAQDGATTITYTLTVTRSATGANTPLSAIAVEKPINAIQLDDDGIIVHQGISPNGDGINDFLQIDNISQYPDNKVSIMNRNGQLVFEAKGYDNASKVFDGHSTKNGQMQLPGTYFYSLEYTVKGVIKHKTGFLVLKY